jgi:hypothetical protein
MGDAQLRCRVAGDLTRDAAGLDKKIGEPMEGGKLAMGIGQDSDMDYGRRGRHLSVSPRRMSVLPIRILRPIAYLFHVKDVNASL